MITSPVSDVWSPMHYRLALKMRDIAAQSWSVGVGMSSTLGHENIQDIFADSATFMTIIDALSDAVIELATLTIVFPVPTTVKRVAGSARADRQAMFKFSDLLNYSAHAGRSYNGYVYVPSFRVDKLIGDLVDQSDTDVSNLIDLLTSGLPTAHGAWLPNENDPFPSFDSAVRHTARTTGHNRSR